MASNYRICRDCGRYFEHCTCKTEHITQQGWPEEWQAHSAKRTMQNLGYTHVRVIRSGSYYRLSYLA